MSTAAPARLLTLSAHVRPVQISDAVHDIEQLSCAVFPNNTTVSTGTSFKVKLSVSGMVRDYI